MNVKIVGSWKNDEKEKCYWWSEKSWNWFLKQEKAVNNKACEKNYEKEKERKRKSKQKKPIAL